MIELSAEQLKLLQEQMASEGIDLSPAKPILRRIDRTNLLPSFAQQQLWLVDQLDPGNPAYNISLALQLNGQLNVPVLGSALSEIARRHEALRTSFSSVDGRPRQVIHPPEPLQLSLVDLETFTPSERQTEAKRLIAEEAFLPFDLARGPLFRATLLPLGEREHILLLTMHHIVSDGWSMSILWRELHQLYSAFLAEQASPLEELPIQYADYAAWQREQLTEEVLAEQLNYWKQQLAGAPPLLELPTDHVRPAVQSNRGAGVIVGIDPGEADSLREVSRAGGVTLFMTLAAAFALLLSRYSGQEEVVMGTPVAGRNRREVESLIGFFINTLVLRTDLRGDPTFRELLARVRDICLNAYAHQDVPFEKLIEELKPKRDQSHSPILQVYLNMFNFQKGRMRLPGLEITALDTPMPSKFDLTLYVLEEQTGLRLRMVYNTDLFERRSVVEMMDQLRHLLSQIARDPSRKISHFSLVTPTTADLLPDPTKALGSSWQGAVQDLFSQCARKWPNHLAVKDEIESWTYAELEAQSNRLANYLLVKNLKRQDVVAIYGHRSAALVWAVLGVLKAGAVFCILDPTHPESRSIEYLSVAKPRAWLQIEAAGKISSAFDEAVTSLSPLGRLLLSSGSDALMNYSADDPRVEVGPDDLASLTFTSGSTGNPKGVLGRHQSLSHFAAWVAATFDISESDRFSMLSNLSHDPLQRDIFTPLQLGATLCIPDQEEIGNPGWLAQWMVREGVSVSNLTPPMIGLLTQTTSEPREISTLRYAFVVGDVLTRSDVARLRDVAPCVTCINLYGTTETQRALGYYIVPDQITSSEKESLPIGRGIDEVQLLVLNQARQLCGVGELGEVYVRSPHLAMGYLDDTSLTQERFIINPFTKVASDRLYRTGDLGRCLADGNVELFGRSDRQVQIRGFRVEPAEIESALEQDSGVSDCVVVAREGTDGKNQLVAYLVPAAEVPPATTDLTRSLREKLPAYMIPAAFVMMKSLPLTANGKVDRRALPPPDLSRPELETGYVAASTPVEEIIAGILGELLQMKQVGVHDNFFDLGGHSLLAMQLVARVRAAFRVAVPLRDVLETPTVSGLAASIERQLLSSSASAPPLVHLDETEPKMSFSQEGWLLREWWEDVHRLERRSFHISTAFRLTGPLDLKLFEQALNEVIRRHDVLRSNFPRTKGILSQKKLFPIFRRIFALKQLHNRLHKLNYKGASDLKQPLFVGGRKLEIRPPANFPLRVVDLHSMSEAEKTAETSRIINDEISTPFDYTGRSSPLLRAVVIKLGAEEHVINVVMHHLIADGMSNRIFLRDLLSFYDSLARGRPSTLPQLPIQYQDFARWQRQWFRGENLESMISYWKEQFTGVGLFPELALPFTSSSAPNRDLHKNVSVQVSKIDSTLYESLRRVSHQQGVTLHMMCIGALNALLHRYTGRRKISIFAPFANRTRMETQDLIGWFSNIHVLTTDCSDDLPFSELLERVRRVVLGAYAHQEVPYLLLVKLLLPQREDYEMPQRLFEVPYVLFDFTAHTPRQLQVADLTFSSFPASPSSGDAGMEVRVLEQADGLKVIVKHSPDRVAPAHVRQMLADFHALVEDVVANPDARLRDLPVATAVK